jgi:hypothetical protein
MSSCHEELNMSDSDSNPASRVALQNSVDKVLAELGPQLKERLVLAAGPNPRTGSANLKKLIDDKLAELSKGVVDTAGPNRITG